MRSASFDREEVIDKIMNAFWEHGYEATSIQVLEAATGLKRQSLYNAFGNKDAMFELANVRYQNAVLAGLLAKLDQDDPKQALHEFFAAQLEVLVDDNRPSGCFVAAGQQELSNRPDNALGDEMVALIGDQYAGLTAVFERWKEEGKLTADAEPGALASVVMSLLRGQAVMSRNQASRSIITDCANTLPILMERYLVS
ncbi:TetR/AcrR family transcriptional regulator [Erythrobacter sp. SCSIO 43205]|uniref:TetR/AcrR family transcriptional regulator n=1 Tax=Erythrobacter sp. SCSIO 43205 TaxID=2779361 RepID=UPI001CA95B86|nr:TetR/AcrR family transcriptional regulator [Erythrobacter sp. SCSIO 43205]UAB77989.1 TetR/AcrR family transcriptional regulator [Erythrobacter sp. SCSIO 43205]